ncbi:MAG: YtxH domain-containing protein [Geothrix sp.]|nr:YtxH domain-containing protein [Geothrix sp.]
MSQDQIPSPFSSLITFLLGAAMGAVVVALTTPRSGPRLRNDLKELARRGKERARRAAEGLRGHGHRSRRTYVWHISDTRGEHPVSVNDLPG